MSPGSELPFFLPEIILARPWATWYDKNLVALSEKSKLIVSHSIPSGRSNLLLFFVLCRETRVHPGRTRRRVLQEPRGGELRDRMHYISKYMYGYIQAQGLQRKGQRARGRRNDRIIKAIRGFQIRYSTSYITNMIIQARPGGISAWRAISIPLSFFFSRKNTCSCDLCIYKIVSLSLSRVEIRPFCLVQRARAQTQRERERATTG